REGGIGLGDYFDSEGLRRSEQIVLAFAQLDKRRQRRFLKDSFLNRDGTVFTVLSLLSTADIVYWLHISHNDYIVSLTDQNNHL
ncbi:MAG: hypothetical protein AABY14_04060, partial [Nanoarchaeota archaeon]